MNTKKIIWLAVVTAATAALEGDAAAADPLTRMSRPRVARYQEAPATPSAELPGTDAQEGVPLAPPDSPAEHARQTAAAAADEEEDVDIYAPPKDRKPSRYKLRRLPGDGDVIVAPSARTLDEGDVAASLDEFLLWRAQLGVSDEFTLEANTLWGLSAGLQGKYALLRAKNTAVSLQAGVGALTVEKSMNWSHVALLYSKDYRRGAVHLGGYGVFVHTPRNLAYFVPQLTAGGEVRIMKRVSALGEVGVGNDVLNAAGIANNTGFVNVGLRIDLEHVFATGALVMPTNEGFLDSSALAIPFLRVGGRF